MGRPAVAGPVAGRRVRVSRDLATRPECPLHLLKGDMAGLWSVSVSGNWRVVFRFEDSEAVDVGRAERIGRPRRRRVNGRAVLLRSSRCRSTARGRKREGPSPAWAETALGSAKPTRARPEGTRPP